MKIFFTHLQIRHGVNQETGLPGYHRKNEEISNNGILPGKPEQETGFFQQQYPF